MPVDKNKMLQEKTRSIVSPLMRQLRNSLFLLLLTAHVPLSAQQKHALVVGISNYPNHSVKEASWSQIHGNNDVLLVAPLLVKQGFEVITICDESATHKAIIDGFKLLSKKSHPGDIVYIHLSGHGQAVEDDNGDEEDGWDEAYIPFDAERCYQKNGYHGEKHLLDDELNEYLNSIRKMLGPTGIVYVVIDACHAGSSYRGDEICDSVYARGTDIGFSRSGKTFTPKIDKRGNIRILTEKGMAPICMLEACRSYEVNTEIMQDGNYYGPLTYYISRQLLTSTLTSDTKWVEEVRKNMDKDIRLVRQHMVSETTE